MAKRPPTLTEKTIELIWYVRARHKVTPHMRHLAEDLLSEYLKRLKRQESKVEVFSRKIAKK